MKALIDVLRLRYPSYEEPTTYSQITLSFRASFSRELTSVWLQHNLVSTEPRRDREDGYLQSELNPQLHPPLERHLPPRLSPDRKDASASYLVLAYDKPGSTACMRRNVKSDSETLEPEVPGRSCIAQCPFSIELQGQVRPNGDSPLYHRASQSMP